MSIHHQEATECWMSSVDILKEGKGLYIELSCRVEYSNLLHRLVTAHTNVWSRSIPSRVRAERLVQNSSSHLCRRYIPVHLDNTCVIVGLYDIRRFGMR